MVRSYDYDVALSFAGEERNYVRAVAASLRSQEVKVFFDEYEQVDMWGKDLYEHLHEVYSTKAKYCVIFISEAYSRKIWTTHERKSAQERALQEHREYILPARFDDTELPGIGSTTGYIDLRNLAPDELAKIIVEKLGGSQTEVNIDQEPQYRIPRKRPIQFNPYDEAERFISILQGKLQERSNALQKVGSSLSIFKRGGKTCFRVVRAGRTLFSMDVWTGGIAGDKGLSFYAINGEIRVSSNSINAWAELIWDQENKEIILKLNDFSLFGHVPSQEKYVTYDEFVERIWERIVKAVDQE
jgi:hypothetical protein